MKPKKPSKAKRIISRQQEKPKAAQPVIRKLQYDSPAVTKAKALIDRVANG